MIIDFHELTTEPDRANIGVLETNRAVLNRVARVIRSAAQLEWVAAEAEAGALAARLSQDALLLACEDTAVDLVLQWCDHKFPQAHVTAWSHDPTAVLIDRAIRHDRLVSLVGWPSFQSMPRSWELALATRQVLRPHPEPTAIGDILTGSPVVVEFHPRTSRDREAIAANGATFVDRCGGSGRTCARVSEVVHELTMNATYDAPVDRDGEPRYAHDRRAPIELEDREVPLVQLATDGMLVAVVVTDPFGRLTRDHVLASIQRGNEAGRSSDTDVIDSSRGGAGLGMWRVYSSAAVTIVDIVPGHSTSVTAVFDIDVAPREARTLPPSLHLFDRGRLG